MSFKSFLKQRVTIQRKTTTRSETGAAIDTWADLSTIAACIRPSSGREVIINGKRTVISDHKMYCFPTNITEKDRVVYDSKTYEVVFVNNVMNKNKHFQVDLKRIN